MQTIDRLILIDDDRITTFLHKALSDQLAIAKEVVSFNCARTALAYLTDKSPQSCPQKQLHEVILLDINMPEMNGFEFLEELITSHSSRHFKIFMVSSSQDSRDINQAKMFPICEYISKPLTEQKMQTIMDKVRRDNATDCYC